MSYARGTVADSVKPCEGAIVRRYTSGTAVAVAEAVYLDASGYVQPTIGTAVWLGNRPHGLAIQAATASGERIDVVTYGPLEGACTGATPGSFVYTTDTAGEHDHTGGTKKSIIGKAETATRVFVNPQIVDWT